MTDPRTLLGLRIKDDAIIAMLSDYEIEIHYDIDTDHENIEDKYWIHNFACGYTLCADKDQVVYVCFVYLQAIEDHQVFPWSIPGIKILNGTIPTLGLPTRTGDYKGSRWLRYDRDALSTHLTNNENGPSHLTFTLLSHAP